MPRTMQASLPSLSDRRTKRRTTKKQACTCQEAAYFPPGKLARKRSNHSDNQVAVEGVEDYFCLHHCRVLYLLHQLQQRRRCRRRRPRQHAKRFG